MAFICFPSGLALSLSRQALRCRMEPYRERPLMVNRRQRAEPVPALSASLALHVQGLLDQPDR